MRFLLSTIFTAGLLSALPGAESDASLVELPQPVKLAIVREAMGKPVGAIERERKDARTLFHVRIEQEGIDKRVTLSSEGEVLEVRDHAEVNNALATGKQASKDAWDKTKEVSGDAWDKTKEVAGKTWLATKETVSKATSAFKSDELTLNQVPLLPRSTLEREAAGDRLGAIRARTDAGGDTTYHATVTRPDGGKRDLAVREDGTLVPP